VDLISFGTQNTDITEGGFPDGSPTPYVLSAPTPGAPNVLGTSTNQPPVLAAIGNRNGSEGVSLTFTVTASAPEAGQSLAYSLDSAPSGAVINPSSGVFNWTPSEAQGPGVYQATVRVTDNGSPALSDSETITLTISEVNQAPSLPPITARSVNEGNLLSFSVTATDSDLPAQPITYSLDPSAPSGASINPTSGQFAWTPSEAQGPGNYSVTIVATDNGTPPLNSSQTFAITVAELNSSPSLGTIGNQSTEANVLLTFTILASDTDLPAQTLTYSMDAGAPSGASFNPTTRTFAWTPTAGQAPSTNAVTFRVTDNGSAPLSDSETIQIVVQASGTTPPRFTSIQPAGAGQVTLVWTSIAGKIYRVEWKDDLGAATWTPGNTYTAAGTSTSATVPAATSWRFYRLVQTN
jgi:hypothetical protein